MANIITSVESTNGTVCVPRDSVRLALVPVSSEDLNKSYVLIKHERLPFPLVFGAGTSLLWSVGSVPSLWVEMSIIPLPPLPAGDQGPSAASAEQLAKATMSLSAPPSAVANWARALSQRRAHNVYADLQKQALEGQGETTWEKGEGNCLPRSRNWGWRDTEGTAGPEEACAR